MVIVRKIFAVVATVALAVAFVGAGFFACTLPQVTHVLANTFSDDVTSPFSRSQLVQVADATRDYSFGAHDKTALYRAIYDVDMQYRNSVEQGGGAVPADFPKLDVVEDPSDSKQLGAAFTVASEMYCYSSETISHLDDCYALASVAYPLIISAGVIALITLIFTGITGRKRKVGAVLMAAGIVVVVAFIALAVWAIIDFNGFFATFHKLFFSQGNWQFPYDSLLICALPTAFWVGMGAVWLATTVLISILSFVIGKRLRK